MIARPEGASLEAADAELYRVRQARTVGISSLGVGAGGLRATGPSAAAGRLVPSGLFRGNDE